MTDSEAPGDAEDLPPISYMDYREFRRLIRMLDIQQHLNLSAHLYSAHLISRLTDGRLPHREWTAWPLKDAPVPPQIFDDFPSDRLGLVPRLAVERVRDRATETFPLPPDPETDAPEVLLRACEEVLRRIVHRRIEHDMRDIEPILEPEPVLGGVLGQQIVRTVEKYIHRAPFSTKQGRRLASWNQFETSGPAAKRLHTLFNRDLGEYEHIGNDESSGEESPAQRPASPALDLAVPPPGPQTASQASENRSGGNRSGNDSDASIESERSMSDDAATESSTESSTADSTADSAADSTADSTTDSADSEEDSNESGESASSDSA